MSKVIKDRRIKKSEGGLVKLNRMLVQLIGREGHELEDHLGNSPRIKIKIDIVKKDNIFKLKIFYYQKNFNTLRRWMLDKKTCILKC